MPMDVCHLLIDRPWKFDRKEIHNGRSNTYTLEKNGRKHTLTPLENKEEEVESGPRMLLVIGKKILKAIKKEKLCFTIVPKELQVDAAIDNNGMPLEVRDFLEEFDEIVSKELLEGLPPMGSISHHIDLIPREILPNKGAYRLTPIENEEFNKQVQ